MVMEHQNTERPYTSRVDTHLYFRSQLGIYQVRNSATWQTWHIKNSSCTTWHIKNPSCTTWHTKNPTCTTWHRQNSSRYNLFFFMCQVVQVVFFLCQVVQVGFFCAKLTKNVCLSNLCQVRAKLSKLNFSVPSWPSWCINPDIV